MKDLLKYGQYVGRIIEAHNQGQRELERQLANQAEELLDSFVPDLDPVTGEPIQETPFEEQILSEMRSTLDGQAKAEAHLQRLTNEAKGIKAKAEAYLLETEGQRAPGQYYMKSVFVWADSTLEVLAQLSRKVKARAPRKPQPEQGQGNNLFPAIISISETPEQRDGRKSLEIETSISIAEKKELFNALTNAGVFATSNDLAEYNKDFVAFCIFLFGDNVQCPTDHKLTVANKGQGRLAAFLRAIAGQAQESDFDQTAATWCKQYNGRPLNTRSMKAKSWDKYSTQIGNIVKKYFQN